MEDEIFYIKVIMTMMIICMAGFVLFMFVGLVDSFTLQEVGEKSVPCLDEYNRPFEDEMCTKTLTCSYLGIAGQDRCVNVLEDER